MILLIALFFAGCSTYETSPRPPLSRMILKARKGHNGLTHSRCKKWKNKDICEEGQLEILDFDLNDPELRKKLAFDFSFRCRIAGKRFKVCWDAPGFCQIKNNRKWTGKETVWVHKYIPMNPSEYHVEAGTICASKDR